MAERRAGVRSGVSGRPPGYEGAGGARGAGGHDAGRAVGGARARGRADHGEKGAAAAAGEPHRGSRTF